MSATGIFGKAAGKIAGQADGVEGFEPEAKSPERRRPAGFKPAVYSAPIAASSQRTSASC